MAPRLRWHGGMTTPRVPMDPDAGIPDLVRRLTDDSRRLVSDEVRLAKLETKEGLTLAVRGGLRLAMAFGIGVVAMIALTIFLAAGIGRLVNSHYWAGALITGVIELVLAMVLIKKGLSALRGPSYSLAETRAEAGKTVRAVKQARLPKADGNALAR